MGAWTFVQPNIERVLVKIGAKRTAAALCRPPGVGRDRDGAHEQAHAGTEEAHRRSSRRDSRGLTRFGKGDNTMIEIHVPALGESVTEATIGQWFKKEGEAVKADEPVVELETDKVTRRSAGAGRRRPPDDRRQARRDGECRRRPRRHRRRRCRRSGGRAAAGPQRLPRPAASPSSRRSQPRRPASVAGRAQDRRGAPHRCLGG